MLLGNVPKPINAGTGVLAGDKTEIGCEPRPKRFGSSIYATIVSAVPLYQLYLICALVVIEYRSVTAIYTLQRLRDGTKTGFPPSRE